LRRRYKFVTAARPNDVAASALAAVPSNERRTHDYHPAALWRKMYGMHFVHGMDIRSDLAAVENVIFDSLRRGTRMYRQNRRVPNALILKGA
jgi:hypothetical protein